MIGRHDVLGIPLFVLSLIISTHGQSESYTLRATCDNTMTLYVDGQEIQPTSGDNVHWNQEKIFAIPSTFQTIAIKCVDVGSQEGILASVQDDTGQVILLTDNTWRCAEAEQHGWTLAEFQEDPEIWKSAGEIGPHGMSPWMQIGAISLEAKWIWYWGLDTDFVTSQAVLTSYCRFSRPGYFTPESGIQYWIQKVDGSGAGYTMSYNSDQRNGASYWVHTQVSDGTDEGEKWEITVIQYNQQTCYKIKALYGLNSGRMLVAHSDIRENGDARVLVHSAGHKLVDECWIIKGVKENGVTVGYTIMKSQSRNINKYLISTVVRDDNSFWVDVTDDVQAHKIWNVLPFKSKPNIHRYSSFKYGGSSRVSLYLAQPKLITCMTDYADLTAVCLSLTVKT